MTAALARFRASAPSLRLTRRGTIRRLLAVLALAAVTSAVAACDPTGSGAVYYQPCPAGQHAAPIPGVPGQQQCVKGQS